MKGENREQQPFSWLPGEQVEQQTHVKWEDRGRKPDKCVLHEESAIETRISSVLERHLVPEEDRLKLHNLILDYIQAKFSYRRATKAWEQRRGGVAYELEYLLQAEDMELSAVHESLLAYLQANRALKRYLQTLEPRGGYRNTPPETSIASRLPRRQ